MIAPMVKLAAREPMTRPADNASHQKSEEKLVIFSDATAADVLELVDLINTAYRTPGDKPGWTDERSLLRGTRTDSVTLASELKSGRYLIAKERDDSPVVACARITAEDDGVWYVASVAVNAARQGGGTGRLVLGEIARQARAANVQVLRITVINLREQLIAWYERRGFVRTGETEPFPYDDPSVGRPLRDDLVLVKLEMPL